MRSSGEAARSLLKSVTLGKSVLAKTEPLDKTVSSIVCGVFSLSEDGFKVSGTGESVLVFEPDAVASCETYETADLPQGVATVLDMATGVPFITVYLENGIQIAFQHFTTE